LEDARGDPAAAGEEQPRSRRWRDEDEVSNPLQERRQRERATGRWNDHSGRYRDRNPPPDADDEELGQGRRHVARESRPRSGSNAARVARAEAGIRRY
jgi:hypothetical protein